MAQLFVVTTAALFDWDIHQIDIKLAYLNGLLNEERYMEQPQGFEVQGQETKVSWLLKALYGLKQAVRQWHEHLQHSLTPFSYRKLISGDVSIFLSITKGGGSQS